MGGMVNTLLRNEDRVRIGCLAQIINVIAALVTNKEGVLRQTIYYPYSWGIKYAKGGRAGPAGPFRDLLGRAQVQRRVSEPACEQTRGDSVS